MNNKQRNTTLILIILIILENLFLYYFFRNGLFTQGKNAIGLFLTSVLFGVVLIWKFYGNQIHVADHKKDKKIFIPIAVMAGCMALIAIPYAALLKIDPISIQISDILPAIQIIVKRFVHGQYPYSIIYDFGFPQRVSYLPMHWLPFSIAEIFHFDYRWITYIAWCTVGLWLCKRSFDSDSLAVRYGAPVIIAASYYILFVENPGLTSQTVEVLISAYYMFLIVTFNQKNGIVIGVAMACCLLSRYTVVLWLPLYCFVLFITGNRKQLYISAATATVIVVVIFVLPYLTRDLQMFLEAPKAYDGGAHYEWTHINPKNGKPFQLFNGMGFAYYIYTRLDNPDVMDRVKVLQKIHLICSILVIVSMGIWFWFKKDRIDVRIFLMSSFKIYLAVFLFFIQVPYEYLMIVGNFISIVMFCEQARYRITSKEYAPAPAVG